MKTFSLALWLGVGLAMPTALEAASLLERYWPMNDGDIRYYDGPLGESYVSVSHAGGSLFDFSFYEYDEEDGSFFSSTRGTFGYAGDTVLEYEGEVNGFNLSWDPPLQDLDEESLAVGMRRTSHSVLSVLGEEFEAVVTITVAPAGSVTVPAGRFHNCRSVSVQARVAELSLTIGQVWVLAPNIGQIRVGVVNSRGGLAGYQNLTGGTVGGVDVHTLANQPAPVLAITRPRANERVGQPDFTVHGTARDDVSVSSVWVQLNGGDYQMAETTNGWTNWTASVSLPPGTNSLRAFAEDGNGTPSLVRAVRFIYDPILPFIGAYTGLFNDSEALEHGSSGLFKATVRAGGAFSALLQTGSRRAAFSGRLDYDGKFAGTVPRPRTNALQVELCLKLDGSDELIGSVTDGVWSSGLLADRAVFDARANPATNFAARYTMLVPGSTAGSQMAPAGHGFATVTISRAGLATMVHTLADGSPATASLPVSRDGDVPWYLSLYGGGGSALGWLRVTPEGDSHLGGDVAWFKPPQPRARFYTNGFALETMAVGSLYAPFGTNRLFEADDAVISFADGGLAGFDNTLKLGPRGRVTNTSPNRLTLQAVSANGLFNGTVTPPTGGKPIAFKGALLQKQGYGGGYFLNTNESGSVVFSQ